MVDGHVLMGIGQRHGRIAVLSKKALTTHRYDEWLAPAGLDVELFAEDSPQTRETLRGPHGFAQIRLFTDWKRNRAVDQAVLASHAEHPFTRIVALSECDIIRAAELRERLGLRGQQTASAVAFRDKWVMKELAADAGLDVPEFRRLDSAWDLVDFASRHDWSVVVKPAEGAGSVGVALLRGRDAVDSWLEHSGLSCDEPSGYLVEELIDAPMLALDGLMCGGVPQAVAVSAYTVTCLDVVTRLTPVGVLMLDPADPRVPAAVAYLERVLKALPSTDETLSFHCELFDTADRGMLLCEIACRTGGGTLRSVVRHAFGVDPEYAACLGQAGTGYAMLEPHPEPGQVFGCFLMPRSGLTLPRGILCDVPGVAQMTIHHDRMAADQGKYAVKVSDSVIDALLMAADHAALCRTCDDVVAWIGRHGTFCGEGAAGGQG